MSNQGVRYLSILVEESIAIAEAIGAEVVTTSEIAAKLRAEVVVVGEHYL